MKQDKIEEIEKLLETIKNCSELCSLKYKPLKDFISSTYKLAYEQGRKDEKDSIFKYLKNNYIKYCKEQNGMPYCKNCGLDLIEMERDLINSNGENKENNS